VLLPALALAALAAAPASAPVPAGLQAAAARALRVAGARVEVRAYQPSAGARCVPDAFQLLAPVEASGRFPVRTSGADARGAVCEGWGFAEVRVLAPALVLARTLRAGEPLEGALHREEAELPPRRVLATRIPEGAVAARRLPAGVPLAGDDVHVGPRPGEAVTVAVRAGALQIERAARAVACPRTPVPTPRPAACAVLPSGKRVEGVLEGGRIVVEAP
jgi:flagella basal body P-ring formation protein FlgA